jgi:homoserine kinase type II
VDTIDLTGPRFDPLRRAYDLGEWVDWRQAERGSSELGFLTTTRGRYAVRGWHENKTEAAMRFQSELLDFLGAGGYPAPREVPTRNGEPYLSHGASYLVTEFIPGAPYDPDNPAHLWAAGRALAYYHQVVRGFSRRFRAKPQPLLVALECLGPATLAAFGKAVSPFLSPAEGKRLSRAMSQLWVQFLRVPEALIGVVDRLPQLVVHGAFGCSALVFDGDRVTGVVGYGRSGYERRAMDLAYAVKAFAGDALDLDRCAAFMAAYGESEDLAPYELAALPLVFRGQGLVEVLGRTETFLRQEQPQSEEEALKVVGVIVGEAARTQWLEEHEDDLLLAMGGAALV